MSSTISRLTPRRTRSQSPLSGVLLLVPTIVAVGAISLAPIAITFIQAFRNTTLSVQSDEFTGMANISRLFADDVFRQAWWNTIRFVGVATLAETILGVAFALVLHRQFAGRGMVRAAILIPWVIPTVVTSRIFEWMFDGEIGVVNFMLTTLGLVSDNVNFLGSESTALTTLIFADVWKTTPFMTLLVLAALQSVSAEVSESASLDGAGPWRIFWDIRLPIIAPALLVAALIRALDTFRVFDLVYILTGGGPANSTEVLSTYAYKLLFSGLEFGYGSTVVSAMFLTEVVVAIIFGLFIVRRFKKLD